MAGCTQQEAPCACISTAERLASSSFSSCCAARLYIDDPLFTVPDTSRLVALCAVADTLIERVQKVPKSAASFDVGILQEIEALCRDLAPKKHAQVRPRCLNQLSCRSWINRGRGTGPHMSSSACLDSDMACPACVCGLCAQTTLQDLGLLDLFPYLAMGLSGEQLQMVQQHPGAQCPLVFCFFVARGCCHHRRRLLRRLQWKQGEQRCKGHGVPCPSWDVWTTPAACWVIYLYLQAGAATSGTLCNC